MVKKVWQTDGQTDRRTDWTSHIAAWSQLKMSYHIIMIYALDKCDLISVIIIFFLKRIRHFLRFQFWADIFYVICPWPFTWPMDVDLSPMVQWPWHPVITHTGSVIVLDRLQVHPQWRCCLERCVAKDKKKYRVRKLRTNSSTSERFHASLGAKKLAY